MNLTLESLPQAVSNLQNQLNRIEQQLLSKDQPQNEIDKWFDLTELCEYLPGKPAKATIYAKVNARTIPFYKKSKELSFKKSEIDAWLQSGRVKTVEEITAAADENLANNKKGK